MKGEKIISIKHTLKGNEKAEDEGNNKVKYNL
jgi:hypothetical protein